MIAPTVNDSVRCVGRVCSELDASYSSSLVNLRRVCSFILVCLHDMLRRETGCEQKRVVDYANRPRWDEEDPMADGVVDDFVWVTSFM